MRGRGTPVRPAHAHRPQWLLSVSSVRRPRELFNDVVLSSWECYWSREHNDTRYVKENQRRKIDDGLGLDFIIAWCGKRMAHFSDVARRGYEAVFPFVHACKSVSNQQLGSLSSEKGSTWNVKEVFLTLQKGHHQFHGNQQLSAVLGDFDCMKVLVWPFCGHFEVMSLKSGSIYASSLGTARKKFEHFDVSRYSPATSGWEKESTPSRLRQL